MDPLYRSNADNAKHIHAMIMSDYVSDDYSIDDWTESNENYVEPREGECAYDTTSDDYCHTEVNTTDSCFQWEEQDEVR
jgi:hypothetical protein